MAESWNGTMAQNGASKKNNEATVPAMKSMIWWWFRSKVSNRGIFLVWKWRDSWQFSDRARAGYGEVLSHACVAPGVCICWTVQVDAEAGTVDLLIERIPAGRLRTGRVFFTFFRVFWPSIVHIDILPACCCFFWGLRPVQFCLPDYIPGSDDLLQASRMGARSLKSKP